MNITSHTASTPIPTVVNPPTDALRRENHQREIITKPAAAQQSAAEKGVASERDRAKTPAQNNEQIDFENLRKQAELASKTISDEEHGSTHEEEKHQQDSMSGDCGGKGEPEEGDGEGDNDGDVDSQDLGNQPSQRPGQEQIEKEISNMIQQAAMQAKQAGAHVPNSIEQYLDELYNPELPWNQILMKYMSAHNTYDYSYTRVHKKFFPHGIIMPTMYSEGLGHIVAANDQSGSVSDKEYEVYLGALQDIHENLNPQSIRCLGFTTIVNNDTTINQEDDFNKLKFRANGGTDIPCIFDYIEREGIKPEVLIIFSDMESRIPQQQPPYDVIWISVGNSRFTAPFGRTIHVSI